MTDYGYNRQPEIPAGFAPPEVVYGHMAPPAAPAYQPMPPARQRPPEVYPPQRTYPPSPQLPVAVDTIPQPPTAELTPDVATTPALMSRGGKLAMLSVVGLAAAGSAVAVSGYLHTPDNRAAEARQPSREQLLPPATTPAVKPSKTTVSPSPTPAATKLATFSPTAIGCQTVSTISVRQAVPLQQDEQFIGDPNRYRFSDGPDADFVATVTGSMAVNVCLNDPKVLQVNPGIKDPVGTQTYTVSLPKLPVSVDTTKLHALPGYKDEAKVLSDLCTTQKKMLTAAPAQTPTKSSVAAKPATSRSSAAPKQAATAAPGAKPAVEPSMCVLADRYAKNHQDPMIIQFSNQLQQSMTQEAPAVSEAATAETLQLLDGQAANLTTAIQAYVQNAVNQQAAAQAKQAHEIAPRVIVNFTNNLPSFVPGYLKAHAGLDLSIKSLQAAAIKHQPKAPLPAFVIDDSTSDFTPNITLKNR